jgi:hypothetical protein
MRRVDRANGASRRRCRGRVFGFFLGLERTEFGLELRLRWRHQLRLLGGQQRWLGLVGLEFEQLRVR